MLFKEEVTTLSELIEKLSTLDQEFGKIKACVICFVFDEGGNLYLNRRGPGARDEVGMLQAIGGSVNHSDENLRSAMERELKEEAGSDATIEIGEFLGALLNPAIDKDTGETIDWIIMAYVGTLIEGKLENMEPDRCIGFEKAKMEEFNKEEISRSTRIFLEDLLSNK